MEHHVIGIELREAVEIAGRERRRIGLKSRLLARVGAEPRQLGHPAFGRPGHRLQFGDLPVFVEPVGDEKLHRDEVPGMHFAEREIGPVPGRMEIHVDLGEQQPVAAEHGLRAHDLAHAVVRPFEEREQRFGPFARSAGADHLGVGGKEAFDQRRVVAAVEQVLVSLVVEFHRGRLWRARPAGESANARTFAAVYAVPAGRA